jgi:YVTN family beta-propeller protein
MNGLASIRKSADPLFSTIGRNSLIFTETSRPQASRKEWKTMKTKTLVWGITAILASLLAFYGVATVQDASTAQAAAVQATISVGAMPAAIALDEAAGKLYVANFGSGTVSVIDAASQAVVAEIDVGANPNALTIHPARRRVYVLNQGSDTVSVINGETDTVEATVKVGCRPWAMVLDERADRLYVANRKSGTLSVIEGRSLEVSHIPVGKRPVALALDDRGQVYVANQADDTVSIVNPVTGNVSTVPVGQGPLALAYNPVNHRVYVASEEPVVSVIDTDSGREVERMLVSARASLAIDPVSGRIYLAGEEKLLALGVQNSLLWAIPLPALPTCIVPDSDTGQVYVSHWNLDALSIVNVATERVTTVSVGANPSAIVVDNERSRIFVVNTAYPAEGQRARAGDVAVLDVARLASAAQRSSQAANGQMTATMTPTPTPTPILIAHQWQVHKPPTTIAGNNVQGIVQAADGALWFATYNGVSRFDGAAWTTYTTADGLVSDYVQSVAGAADGTLWFGTSWMGVSRFDGANWTTYTTADGLASNYVQGIIQAADGALWFATWGGVSRFDGAAWTTYTTADGLVSNYVLSLAQAADGALWFGTGVGASRFDGVTWTTYTMANGLADNQVNAIAGASDGLVWFGTGGGGVSRFDGITWTTYTSTTHGLASDYVYSVAEASDGALWFGTDGGVGRFDGATWTTYTSADGLVSDYVQSVAGAADGALWFGTWDGASRFDGSTWTTYAKGTLQRLIVAADDTVWIGAKSGVLHFDGAAWTTYSTADGLPSSNVQALAQASGGDLWFGTAGGGVSRFDGAAWTTYTTADGLAGNNVQAVTEAADGAMWFGTTDSGVSRFDGVAWTTYTTADGLANDDVRTIAQALDGALWFGTWGGGVSRFDGTPGPGAWTTYTTADGLASDYADEITVTPDGRVWVYYGWGFSIFDGGQWIKTWLSPLSGGYGLSVDQAGNYWYARGALKGYDGLREYEFLPSDVYHTLADLALDSQEHKWVIDRERLYRFEGTLPALKEGSHVLSVRDPDAPPDDWPPPSLSLELAENAGFQFVQIPVRWADLEPVQGQYDWELLKHIQAIVDSYDLFPLLRISGAPGWASSGATGTLPINPQYLEDFMHALAGRFGSQFAYVIWNEPNLPGEWWGQAPNAADYVTLLQAAYQGVKSAHPMARVISAGLAPTEGGDGAVRDLDFLEQMYAAGLANYCDAVGLNGLGFAYSPDDTSDPNGYNFSRLADLHQVMVDNGDGDRSVWLLEVGWLRDSDVDLGSYNWYKVTEQQQAAYLARAIEKTRGEWPWVEVISLWNLDYDRFLSESDQRYWFSFGQSYGYLAVARMWPPYFHNQCGVTNQVRPVLQGSAPPLATVNVYLDGALLMTTTATYSSTFEAALPADLTTGTHVFTATATNPLTGETGDISEPLALTVDPTLPFDPLGVYFIYQYPGASWTGVRVPKDNNGCVVPGAWAMNLVPSVATTVHVPVTCGGSTEVSFVYGANATPLSHSGGGWYEGTFIPPGGANSFAIVITCDGDTTRADGTLLIDPDGVVYDAALGLSAPLSGAAVTCERYEGSLDAWTTWDAWNYPYQGVLQVNPQETSADGYYAFMVPPGQYRVKARLDGYWPYVSSVLTVVDTPVRLDIPLERRSSIIYLPLILKEQ